MSLPINDQIYGNMSVLHPDGSLMFRCNSKRTEWYLSRGLAIEIDPQTIQLTFIPKGRGHPSEPYYLVPKENKCVVCGSEEFLTRHHAVPLCFRRHFPENLKSRSSHDIVPLCVDCHETYEFYAHQLKHKLMKEYKIPSKMRDSEEWKKCQSVKKVRGIAKNLFENFEKIPEDRRQFLFGVLNQESPALKIEKEFQTREDLEDYINLPFEPISRRTKQECSMSKQLVAKLENIEEFIRTWRQHFVDTMKPQYLPPHWDVNHRLSNG